MKRYLLSLVIMISSVSMVKGKEIMSLIKKGNLVFDVGAHNGDKTIHYLHAGAKVVCFEPQPLCIERLRTRFSSHPFVFIVPKGLGSSETSLKMMICSQAPTLSTITNEWKEGRFKHYTWDKEILVEITTLDKAIEQFGLPDFCKIDVEGFELEVLKGLSKPIPCISFEITSEYLNNAEECLNLLSIIGYKKFNFGKGESPFFYFDEFITKEKILSYLKELALTDTDLWGDLYAKI